MNINEKIFRAYDVRGVYQKDIDEDIFYLLGKVFAVFIGRGKIITGRDIRSSSESLSESFIKGILDGGVGAVDIGVVTTPMLYYAVKHFGGSAGAMITASHNSFDFNGIKFTDKEAMPISGLEIGALLKKFKTKNNIKKGKKETADVAEDYLTVLVKGFGIKRKINVKIQNEESAVNLFLGRFLKNLGLEFGADSFIDFSVSFDADGDRLIVFDEKEKELRGDIAGGIIAESFLRTGEKIVCDLVSTKALEDYFKEKGMGVIKSKVGHYYIKKKMKEIDAVFGLEVSGHYYFKELNYVESALFALRKLLEALDKNPKSKISELAKPFEKYFNSGEINIPVSSEKEFKKILVKIKDKYADGRQSFEDGILVECNDWWFNLRISNTEPVMRLTIEADSRELLEQKKSELLSTIPSLL